MECCYFCFSYIHPQIIPDKEDQYIEYIRYLKSMLDILDWSQTFFSSCHVNFIKIHTKFTILNYNFLAFFSRFFLLAPVAKMRKLFGMIFKQPFSTNEVSIKASFTVYFYASNVLMTTARTVVSLFKPLSNTVRVKNMTTK